MAENVEGSCSELVVLDSDVGIARVSRPVLSFLVKWVKGLKKAFSSYLICIKKFKGKKLDGGDLSGEEVPNL